MPQEKKILVTVGTTDFDELIKYTSSEAFLNLLREVDGDLSLQQKEHQSQNPDTKEVVVFQNFSLLYQIGKTGSFIPQPYEHFRLSNEISKIYASSDYIICHGGAGTLIENLHNGKKIIAVVNDSLAGNHQSEIVKKMHEEGYLIGFQNVEEFRKNEAVTRRFFSDQLNLKSYEKPQRNIMNRLIFEQE